MALLIAGAVAVVAAVVVLLILVTGGEEGERSGAPGGSPDASGLPDASHTPAPEDLPQQPGRLVGVTDLAEVSPEGTRGWRILYTTTALDGGQTLASGTVLAPAETPREPLPVLGVAHGTIGVGQDCAPSLTDQPFAGLGAVTTTLVLEGWVGVSPDYRGLGTPGTHPYLVGEAAAYDTLDAVRAAHELVELAPETALWGHSQGGHAVLWAGAEAQSYAPDLALIGVAATGPATDLEGLLRMPQQQVGSKLVTAYLLDTWSEVYPDLDPAAALPAAHRKTVDRIAELCSAGPDAAKSFALAQTLPPERLGEEVLTDDLVTLLGENTPTRAVGAPLLVAQGAEDPLVPRALQREWAAGRCAQGQAMDYREYADTGHTPGTAMLEDLLDWLRDRRTGEPVTDACPK